MKSIVKACDGTFIDLSRVIAIGNPIELPGNFKVSYGFDVCFLPEGIPFKQDQVFKVTIIKTYDRPYEVSSLYCHMNINKERLELVSAWQAFKGEKSVEIKEKTDNSVPLSIEAACAVMDSVCASPELRLYDWQKDAWKTVKASLKI